MADVTKILKQLHPLEHAVLLGIEKAKDIESLVAISQKQEIEVRRALQWLSNKGIVETSEETKQLITLGSNGKRYAEKGLPEKRLLNVLAQKEQTMEALMKHTDFEKGEVPVSLGVLKQKAAIDITPDKIVKITEQGKKMLTKTSLEETFLSQSFPLSADNLKPEDTFALTNLQKRRDIIQNVTRKILSWKVTELGKKLCAEIQGQDNVKGAYAEQITHGMLVDGSWKNKSFRHYDIHADVPAISGGKRHFVHQSRDYIKRVWLDMGFQEMEGSMVQSAFWDLDALFVPQDHPARTMQDTFYLANPREATIPPALIKKIKEVHLNGADTGSKGWRGTWSEKEAKKNILRTHTTVLSAQTIARLKKEDLPAKFFAVHKVFRNETLTWKHLFEFHQVEGIVIDPDATLAHLKGYLTEFYTKLGFSKVRMRPAHFPYTEPSLEVDVFHPVKKQWIELGGAGIFRPEVVKPLLGIDVPVLAWGQGLERGIMDYYKFSDIRQLYNNDLKELREARTWY
ncbi:MAG: phenylalanine--tRNA ligase subunit alpha [Candidatus Woesearchaeota archaeon]